MLVYAENEPMMRRLWRRIERRMRRYPPALRRLSVALLESLGKDRIRYFSSVRAAPLLHLPLWLGPELPAERLLDVLEPTALAYLHVRIQDDVLDEPTTRGHADWLLLGNALLWDALEGLRSCCEAPRFWRLAGAAWTRFSEATAAERRQLFAPTREYSEAAFSAHARKVALAEIPLYAVMALRDDWTGVRKVAPLVHLLGRAYGLANDVYGLEPDLRSQMTTYVISQLRQELPAQRRNRPEALLTRALESEVLERALGKAIELHERSRPLGRALRLHRFDMFTDERVEWLRQWSDQISIARLAAAARSSHSAKPRRTSQYFKKSRRTPRRRRTPT